MPDRHRSKAIEVSSPSSDDIGEDLIYFLDFTFDERVAVLLSLFDDEAERVTTAPILRGDQPKQPGAKVSTSGRARPIARADLSLGVGKLLPTLPSGATS